MWSVFSAASSLPLTSSPLASAPYPLLPTPHVPAPLALTFMTLPFLWAGLALVSIPIAIHLLNRRRFKVENWAAMEFLLRAMRKNRKRLKFEQWILLATRCLLIALIGVALARPLTGCTRDSLAGTLGGRSGLSVFVIDNSYSAGYDAPHPASPGGTSAKNHLEQQKLIAKRLIDGLSGGGESVAIVTAARPATAVIAKPGYDLNAAKAAIDRIELTAAGTDLPGALQLALQIGRESPKAPVKQLHVLTDGTKSAWEGPQTDALKRAGPELAAVYRVTHYNLTEGRPQWNQAALALAPTSNLVTTQFDSEIATLVRGYGAGPDATAGWTLDGQPLLDRRDEPRSDRIAMKLDPSTAPVVRRLPAGAIKRGGPHLVAVTLGAEAGSAGDPLKIDDKRYRVVDVASELKVLIVQGTIGDNPMQGSGAFLQLALAPPAEAATGAGANKSGSYVATDLISDIELRGKALLGYRAVILAGVGQVSEPEADALQQFVAGGGTLLLFMGEPVNKDNYNAVLLPRKLLPGPLVKLMDSGLEGAGFGFDFKPSAVPYHPYLKMFHEVENTGLDTAKVFKYWQADVPANSGVERILNYLPPAARPDAPAPAAAAPNNAGPLDPAFTVHPLGKGLVVFCATSASPGKETDVWTSFPAKPSYVALMHEILSGGVRAGDYWMNLSVGQSLEVPPEVKLTGTPELKDDAGAAVLVEAVTEPNKPTIYRSRPLTRPGVYTLNVGSGSLPIAVNVPDDEADVRTIGNEQVRKALGDIEMTLRNNEVPSEASLSRESNDWAGSVLIAMLVLLGIESAMALRFGHYRRATVTRA